MSISLSPEWDANKYLEVRGHYSWPKYSCTSYMCCIFTVLVPSKLPLLLYSTMWHMQVYKFSN
jgi:hypothetical protein